MCGSAMSDLFVFVKVVLSDFKHKDNKLHIIQYKKHKEHVSHQTGMENGCTTVTTSV